MKFEGTYKAVKVVKMVEGQGFVFEDIDKVIAQADDEDKRIYEQTARSLLIVEADGSIKYAMGIPEGTPAEEIEKAKKHGMVVSDDGKYIITKCEAGKIEDDALYLYDKSTFLAGTEWVKISTDVEGELNLVTTLYRLV